MRRSGFKYITERDPYYEKKLCCEDISLRYSRSAHYCLGHVYGGIVRPAG